MGDDPNNQLIIIVIVDKLMPPTHKQPNNQPATDHLSTVNLAYPSSPPIHNYPPLVIYLCPFNRLISHLPPSVLWLPLPLLLNVQTISAEQQVPSYHINGNTISVNGKTLASHPKWRRQSSKGKEQAEEKSTNAVDLNIL